MQTDLGEAEAVKSHSVPLFTIVRHVGLEIHRDFCSISEICKVFLGRALGVDLGSISNRFGNHFGSSWVPKVGKKAIQKP